MATATLIGCLVGLAVGVGICHRRHRILKAQLEICENYIAKLVHQQIFGFGQMPSGPADLSRALAELLQEKDILTEEEIIDRLERLQVTSKRIN